MTTGGMSNVLRRLDSRGLVSRVPDPSDGRRHNVQLTPAGVITGQGSVTPGTSRFTRPRPALPAGSPGGRRPRAGGRPPGPWPVPPDRSPSP
ncbi:MarR family winged helix-turn-helix transcriptional regulator [Streptomyces sp. NBC_01012]|uniref:MarR family winged helix-turn-helix transcriptional regulator n=1 Tax=Streptomyces sp. NBC_01012 TaxID=2903717 RepID=UPI0038706A78